MNSCKQGAKVEFKSARGQDAVERFLKSSDDEFKRCNIVGRKFESVDDHAAFIRNGGYAKIIKALAAA